MAVKLISWWPRFWAWLIDIIILGVISWILLPFRMNGLDWNWPWHVSHGIIALIYWTVLDADGRQSLGKMALNIRAVNMRGKSLNATESAISAFGKAFLLPIDMIIGVLARPGKKQRLFNIASNTTVTNK